MDENTTMVDEAIESIEDVTEATRDYKTVGIIGLATAGAAAATVFAVKVVVPWASKKINAIKSKREEKVNGKTLDEVKAEVDSKIVDSDE